MADDQESDQEKCMSLAAPLLPEFHDIWHHAVDFYKKMPPEFTAEHDDTTAANCIRSHAWTDVARRFDGRKGFKLLKLQRLNLLLCRDETVWRFKRVDGAGRYANYQTQQQMDFDDQLEFEDLPPEAVRLTSGYQPDTSGQLVERVIVARPFGPSIIWASQVNMVDGAAQWVDITPRRLPGTDRLDFRGRRSRR